MLVSAVVNQETSQRLRILRVTAMSKILHVCVQKSPMSEQAKVVTTERQSAGFDLEVSPDNLKETDASEMSADKKTDEPEEPTKRGSLLWRLSSSLYSGTTGVVTGVVGLGVGAVGAGVGGVKWVAGKGVGAGSAVIATGKSVVMKVPTWRRGKDKCE